MNKGQLDPKFHNTDGSINYFATDGVYVGTFLGYSGVEEAYVSLQRPPPHGGPSSFDQYYNDHSLRLCCRLYIMPRYGRRKPKKPTPKV